MMTWDPVWCQSNRHGATFLSYKDILQFKKTKQWQLFYETCNIRATRWRHRGGALSPSLSHTDLDTHRVFFPPQMSSLGAALLRQEGVKIWGFSLTAAPVFHPGDARQTHTQRNFSVCGMSIKRKTRARVWIGHFHKHFFLFSKVSMVDKT